MARTALNVNCLVYSCSGFCKVCGDYRHKEPLIVFSYGGPINIAVKDMLRLLLKTWNGNLLIIVKTKRCSKLRSAIHVSKRTVLHAALTSIENWIMPYRIPDIFELEVGSQLVKKFFKALWSFLTVRSAHDNCVSAANDR